MGWSLAFAGHDDAHFSDRERVLRAIGCGTAEGDEDALRSGRAVVDIGATAVRRGLYDLTALDKPLLALI